MVGTEVFGAAIAVIQHEQEKEQHSIMSTTPSDQATKQESSEGVMTVVSCHIREDAGVDKKAVAKFFRSALGAVRQQGYVFSHSESRFDLVFTDSLAGVHWCSELIGYFLGGRGPKGLGVGIGVTLGMTYRKRDQRAKRYVFEGATVAWARRFAKSASLNQLLAGDVLWANMRRHAYTGKLHLGAHSLGVHRFAGVEGAREVMELRPTGFEEHQYPTISTLGTNITNLSDDPGNFIGREQELSAIRRLFEEGQNLVSIVGAPGMGASRLASRYGALQLGEYPGGVWACALQEISTAGGMLGRLAQVLRLPIQVSGIGSSNKVAHSLADRPSALIILDGVDALIDVCSLTVGVWKERAPNIDFLVTSHTRIGLPGECVMHLDPMTAADGVDLFLRCARDKGARLQATEGELAAIETIIKRVDGMPLGIVLAAGWTDMMSVGQLETRLRSGLGLLSRSRPGSRGGQRTLNSTMGQAWNNLSIEQRSLLGQCSIFKSPFTIEDVESVVEMHRFPNPEAVVELLLGICECSLARSSQRDDGEVVFEIYAASREYGRQHLASSGEQRAILGRLTEHVLSRARKVIENIESGVVLCMEPYLLGCGNLARLERVLNGLGSRSTSQVPVRVSIELHRARGDLCILRGDLNKATESFEEGLKLISSSLGREFEWKLRLRLAIVSFLQGKPAALEQLDKVVEACRAAEDRVLWSKALMWKSRYLCERGQFEECYEVICLARSTAKEIGLPLVDAEACTVLADLERQLGQTAKGAEHCAVAEHSFFQLADELHLSRVWLEQAKFELDYDNPDAARKLALQARSFFMTQSMRLDLGNTYRVLGLANHLSGNLNQGLEDFQESIRLLSDAGDMCMLGTVQWDLGRLIQEAGNAKRAQAQFQSALDVLQTAGAKRLVALVEASIATLMAEEGQIGESNMIFKRASAVLSNSSDPVGSLLCRLFEAQLQLAQAWRVGPRKGPALRAKAMDTYRGMREPSTKPERANGRLIEVRLLLRLLRRRIKQASK